MKTYIQINPQDNVCVALAPISAGTQINAGTTVTTLEDIPQSHKIALADIKEWFPDWCGKAGHQGRFLGACS